MFDLPKTVGICKQNSVKSHYDTHRTEKKCGTNKLCQLKSFSIKPKEIFCQLMNGRVNISKGFLLTIVTAISRKRFKMTVYSRVIILQNFTIKYIYNSVFVGGRMSGSDDCKYEFQTKQYELIQKKKRR